MRCCAPFPCVVVSWAVSDAACFGSLLRQRSGSVFASAGHDALSVMRISNAASQMQLPQQLWVVLGAVPVCLQRALSFLFFRELSKLLLNSFLNEMDCPCKCFLVLLSRIGNVCARATCVARLSLIRQLMHHFVCKTCCIAVLHLWIVSL